MKRTLSLIIVAACALSLCSCGEKQVIRHDEISKLSFSWWGNDVRNEYTIEGIKVFQKKNKDTHIDAEYGEYSGFKEKMDMEIYSDTESDVMQLNYDWLHEYSPDGNEFYNLNDLSEYIDLDNFTSEQLSYGTIDGKLNGISISLNTITFFTNKSLYDSYGLDVPKTWDDYFAAAKVMKRDEIYPLMLSEKTFWLCANAYYEQTTGKTTFDEDGNFILDKDGLQTLLEFYKRLIDEKVSRSASEFSKNDFTDCLVGTMPVWISDAEYYCKPAQEAGLDITLADYPTTDENYKLYGWYIKPVSLYAIKKDTAEPEAAARLVNFLLNSEDMTALQGTEKGIPMSKSALETLEARDELEGIEKEATAKMNTQTSLEAMNPMLENAQLISLFTSACDNVYFDKQTPEQAAVSYISRMKRLFE